MSRPRRANSQAYLEWNVECLEVCEDMTRRYVDEFTRNVVDPENYIHEERFSRMNLEESAALASAQIRRREDSRVPEGFGLRLDEKRVENVARVAGRYIISDIFSDEKAIVPRRPEPVFSRDYEGMSLQQFQETVAVQYASDMIAAVELGVTPDMVRQFQEREAA